jgi:hypothetical protein
MPVARELNKRGKLIHLKEGSAEILLDDCSCVILK